MTKPVALLINPPVYDFSLFDLFHKPLGLMKIGRWLEDAGYRVKVVDALDFLDEKSRRLLKPPKRRGNGTGKFFRQPAVFPLDNGRIYRRFSRYGILEDSFADHISTVRPDIVLITSGMTYWYTGVVEAVRTSRGIWPDAPIVVGGVYATLLADHCRQQAEPDFVVAGEPWRPLADILRQRGLPVPSAAQSDLVLTERQVWRGAGVVRLNEGCPLQCDYCASRLLSRHFHRGSVQTVLRNLEDLIDHCGILSCAFYDDALLYHKESGLIPLLEEIIERRLNISFYLPNAIHLKYIDIHTARLMKKAGFREIRLGYESSSSDFHASHDAAKVGKGDFENAIELLKEAGFAGSEIITYVMAGMPRQLADEVEASVRHVSSFGVRASIAEYSPVPGTALWDASVSASRFPIAEEPLYQNNSIFAMEWDGFTRGDLQRIKDLSRTLAIESANGPAG